MERLENLNKHYREFRQRLNSVRSKIDSRPPLSFANRHSSQLSVHNSCTSNVTRVIQPSEREYEEPSAQPVTKISQSARVGEERKKDATASARFLMEKNQKHPWAAKAASKPCLASESHEGGRKTINEDLMQVDRKVTHAFKESAGSGHNALQMKSTDSDASYYVSIENDNHRGSEEQESDKANIRAKGSCDNQVAQSARPAAMAKEPVKTGFATRYLSTYQPRDSNQAIHPQKAKKSPGKGPGDQMPVPAQDSGVKGADSDSNCQLTRQPNQLAAVSRRNCGFEMERFKVKVLQYAVQRLDIEIPHDIMRYYKRLTFYKDTILLQKLLRPQLHMRFSVKCKNFMRDLGTISFQLYTEACSDLVLELMKCCNASCGHERFDIIRIFDPIWIEGEMIVESKSAIAERIKRHDPTVIPHNVGPGVLSFLTRTTKYTHFGLLLSFTISFSPLEVPAGSRIAVGFISAGTDVLKQLKKLSTKSGKPTDKILVTKLTYTTN